MSAGQCLKLRGGPGKSQSRKHADFLRCKDVEYVHNSTVTFYGSPDNDPAWSNATAYDCGDGRGYTAGGDGSFLNPLSFATADEEYKRCEIVYLPYIKKYLIHDDYCQTCSKCDVTLHPSPTTSYLLCQMDWTDVYKNNLLTRGGEGNDWKKGVLHIDIWTGGFAESGNGEKQIQCEERLTPDKGQLVVRNPPVDLKASSK